MEYQCRSSLITTCVVQRRLNGLGKSTVLRIFSPLLKRSGVVEDWGAKMCQWFCSEAGGYRETVERSPGNTIRVIRIFALGIAGALIFGCGGGGGSETPADPPPRVTTIILSTSASSTTLQSLGDTIQYQASARDANGQVINGTALTWASSDISVATVDSQGLVTAIGNGTSDITASASGVSSSPARITVSQTPASVILSTSSPATTLESLGNTIQYQASARDANGQIINSAVFAWSSSDASVATVDSAGLVTAVGNGATDIAATAGSVTSSPARVNVSQVPASIELASSPDVLLTAKISSAALAVIVRDAGGSVIANPVLNWLSSDPSVATVDGSGTVAAVANGRSTVTARSGSISSADVNVEVVVEKRLYIPVYTSDTNMARLAVIAPETGTILDVVDLPGSRARFVALNAEGTRVFVVIPESEIGVVAASTNAIVSTIDLAESRPGTITEMIHAKTQNRLYALRRLGPETSEIVIIDSEGLSVIDRVPLADGSRVFRHRILSLSPDDGMLYVLGDQKDLIIAIDTSTNTVRDRYDIAPGENYDFAQTSDGSRLIASSSIQDEVAGGLYGIASIVNPVARPEETLFSFDDNQLPAGWQIAQNPSQWSPGAINNGRLEAVATDQRLQLRYDIATQRSSIVLRSRGEIRNSLFGSIHSFRFESATGQVISFTHQNEEFDSSDGVNENQLRLNVSGLPAKSILIPEKFPTFEYRVGFFGTYVAVSVVDTASGEEVKLIEIDSPFSALDVIGIDVTVAHTTGEGTTWLDDIELSFNDTLAATRVARSANSVDAVPGSTRAYVSGGSLTAIEANSGTSVADVAAPSGCCIGGQVLASGDGTRIYVTQSISVPATIRIVDTATNVVSDTITLSNTNQAFGGLVVEVPEHDRLLWLARYSQSTAFLHVVSLTTRSEVDIIELPGVSFIGDMAISPF